jgi:hypothetical protein
MSSFVMDGSRRSRPDTDQITARQLLRAGVTSGRLHLASLDDAIRLKARSQDPCAEVPRLQVGGPGDRRGQGWVVVRR